ncbi:MAG: alpha/beta fold hydrolase [Rhodospirillales bacterium]|nr:alpha/beta fold hydrolase [Rhodospirillales bacterium]
MSEKTHLVLLPGLLNDAELWAHQRATLADIAEISVPDLTRDDQLSPMARRVLSGAPETFALAGLSMGGYLAQEIMRQAPDRVTRLALLDTSPLPDTHEQSARRRGFIALARKGDFKGVTNRLLPMLIHPDRVNDARLTKTLMDMAGRVGRDGFIRQQQAIMTRPDSRRDLGLIHCPTLVLCGRQDALTPPAVHADMAAAIPNAAFVAVEDCGHLSPLEQPHAVSAVMRYWLSA